MAWFMQYQLYNNYILDGFMKFSQIKTMLAIAVTFFSLSAQALVIDTTATWDGNINSGWLGSGQSFTIDSTDTFFDDITFDFNSASNGLNFSFTLSDALNGGSTLFSNSFTVNNGKGFIDINTNLVGGSLVYALIDYNGYNGASAHFQAGNVYAGGVSNFGANGARSDFGAYDHVFVANFTDGSVSVPEPSVLALVGLGIAGIGLTRRKKKY